MEFDVREIFPADLKDVVKEMEKIGVHEDGIDVMIQKANFRFFLVKNLTSTQSLILKQEALSSGCDSAVHRDAIVCGVEKTSALIFGSESELKILAEKLSHQPFGLKALAMLIEERLKVRRIPVWKIRNRTLNFEKSPAVMGILNTTPDSFYDGGKHSTPDLALKHAEKMIKEGADIIDVGGESTRPFSEPVSEDEELKRTIPVIERLRKEFPDIPISIDTYKSRVADEALSAGADIVNDISGTNFDPKMAEVIAKHNAFAVISHIKGTPKDMQKNPHYGDVIQEIYDYLVESVGKAVSEGVDKNKIAVDVGIGFGKRYSDNLELFRRLKDFKSLGLPLLIGVSRKSVIGAVLGGIPPEERLNGTTVFNTIALLNGADILRVHDVKEAVEVVKIVSAVRRGSEWNG